MIIDAHTHVFNKKVPGFSYEAEAAYFRSAETSGDWLIASMDQAGIDKAFLISYNHSDITKCIAHCNTDFRLFSDVISREYVLTIYKRYPGRFYLFMDSIDPNKEDYYEAFLDNMRNGATGLKLMPGFCNAYLDDERLMRVYAECECQSIPIIADTSYWYVNDKNFPLSEPEGKNYGRYLSHIGRVAEAFPKLRIQLAHYGTPDDMEQLILESAYEPYRPFIDLMKKHANLFTDTAAMPYSDKGTHAMGKISEFIKYLCDELGSERIMYGTDWPYFCNGLELTYRQGVDLIRESELFDPREKDDLLGRTALRFLGDKA
jgi:predicted TIM-barrel fold metal-dependent hydrolase